ncbi:hypothetical protein ACIRRA_12370 [Nocardia sp. NPDC101769]|uniref:hypothetical protein n=1 Tax=Nocardia sp. NPDC101769 TaxID=3364333 RepID=UPI0037F624A7
MARRSNKPGTVLRALARQQDLTEDQFALEYSRAAAQLFGDRAGVAPSNRTIRRWFWGDTRPQHENAQVLELMFPGYRAGDLLRTYDRHSHAPIPQPREATEEDRPAPAHRVGDAAVNVWQRFAEKHAIEQYERLLDSCGFGANSTAPQSTERSRPRAADAPTVATSARLRALVERADRGATIKEADLRVAGTARPSVRAEVDRRRSR